MSRPEWRAVESEIAKTCERMTAARAACQAAIGSSRARKAERALGEAERAAESVYLEFLLPALFGGEWRRVDPMAWYSGAGWWRGRGRCGQPWQGWQESGLLDHPRLYQPLPAKGRPPLPLCSVAAWQPYRETPDEQFDLKPHIATGLRFWTRKDFSWWTPGSTTLVLVSRSLATLDAATYGFRELA